MKINLEGTVMENVSYLKSADNEANASLLTELRQQGLSEEELSSIITYSFEQVWGSSALGFGGVGLSAMTSSRTSVLIPKNSVTAYIFFGDRYAYSVGICNNLWKDIYHRNIKPISEAPTHYENFKGADLCT